MNAPTSPDIAQPTVTNSHKDGIRYTGGKYDPSKTAKQRVAAMRKDIKALQRNGSIPKDYAISCRTRDYGTGGSAWSADITIAIPTSGLYAVPSLGQLTHIATTPAEREAARVFSKLCARHGGQASDRQLQADLDAAQSKLDAKGFDELDDDDMDMLVLAPAARRALELCKQVGEQYIAYELAPARDYSTRDGIICASLERALD